MRKFSALFLGLVMILGTSMNVMAADAAPAASSGAEAAQDTIGAAFGTAEFGEEIVASAQSTKLTDAQTKLAVEQIGDIAIEDDEVEEVSKKGAYHYSGAALLDEQIKSNATQLEKVLAAKGEKDTEETGVYRLSDVDSESSAQWSIVYTADDRDVRFGYLINGNNCSAAVVLHYDLSSGVTSAIDVAYYGTLDGGVSYVADYRAPFSRKLHTEIDELAYEVVYSNMTDKYDDAFADDCNEFAEAAMELWQDQLLTLSNIGYGELGFGAYDVHGFVKNADGSWWYMKADGTIPVSSWLQVGSKWYHFDQDGIMQTGWYEENGRDYYLGADGAMVTGEQTIDGRTYAFDQSGRMVE